MSELQAGAASVVITPPLGIDLTGYSGRPGPAATVHDDLYARAVVLEAGSERGRSGVTRVALVAVDLLGLAPELVAAIRERVTVWTGIPADHLLLNCSHTHAGPATMTLRAVGERDAAYEDVLVRLIASAVSMAAARLAPAQLAFGRGAARVGYNRRQGLTKGRVDVPRNPAPDYDPDVPVLRVNGSDGRPLAVLFSHATHPVILGNQNVGISADLAGAAVAAVERACVGGATGAPALFLQGCCGNIDPIERGTLEAIRHLGSILGAAAAVAAEEAAPLAATPLLTRRELLELPLQQPPSLEECRALRDAEAERVREAEARLGIDAEYALRQPRAMLAWTEDLLRLAAAPEPSRTVPLELQCLRIGDLALVAMGGEALLDLGRAVAARSPAPHTIVMGYCNGLIGYLPNAANFPLGGYEVDVAYKYFGTLMVTDACEERIVEASARLLGELWGG